MKKEIVNTTNSNDTNDRVAAIILTPIGGVYKMLIGHAPNKKAGPNTWDIVGKGHVEVGGNPVDDVVREIWEESNIEIPKEKLTNIHTAKYDKGYMTFFITKLDEVPTDIKCMCEFELWGRKWPEFKEYTWIEPSQAPTYLYLKLAKVFEPILPKIENYISSFTN